MGKSPILKFWKRDVYVVSEQKDTNDNTFPSVTFCLKPIVNRQAFCHLKVNDILPGKIDFPSCTRDGCWEIVNGKLPNKLHYMAFGGGTTIILTIRHPTFVIGCPVANNDCFQILHHPKTISSL